MVGGAAWQDGEPRTVGLRAASANPPQVRVPVARPLLETETWSIRKVLTRAREGLVSRDKGRVQRSQGLGAREQCRVPGAKSGSQTELFLAMRPKLSGHKYWA